MTSFTKATKVHQSDRTRLLIRDTAESQGFTPTTLARAAGAHPQTVRAYWHDPYRTIRIHLLAKLAKALDIPMAQLVEELS